MSFCTFSNGVLSFSPEGGEFGQFYIRFRGNTLRSVQAYKKLPTDPNFILKGSWTACHPGGGGFTYVQDGEWGFCRFRQEPIAHQYQIVPKYETAACNGNFGATQDFVLFSQNLLLSLGHFKVCSWEFHDGSGNYIDIIIMLEDNGGGGPCLM